MDGLSSWTGQNWFNLVQTLGIMGSLLMTAEAARQNAKTREIENLLTISDHHRELWSGVRHRLGLERIFQESAKVLNAPITVEEDEFLNLATAHFLTSWRIARVGSMITLGELAADVHEFFNLPLPRAVWEKTKANRNPQFVRFVDRAIEASGRFSSNS
jgi:hypothetical protein